MLAPLSKWFGFTEESSSSSVDSKEQHQASVSAQPIPPAWARDLSTSIRSQSRTKMNNNPRAMEHSNEINPPHHYHYQQQQQQHLSYQHSPPHVIQHSQQLSATQIRQPPNIQPTVISHQHPFLLAQHQQQQVANHQSHDYPHQGRPSLSQTDSGTTMTNPTIIRHYQKDADRPPILPQRRPVVSTALSEQHNAQVHQSSSISEVRRFVTGRNAEQEQTHHQHHPSESQIAQLGYVSNPIHGTPSAMTGFSSQPTPTVRASSLARNEGQPSPIRAAAEARQNARTTSTSIPTTSENISEIQAPIPVECKPSSLIETERLSGCSEEISLMWKAAVQRIQRLKRSIISLEKSVEAEFEDLCGLESTVKRSQLILHDVEHNYKTARELITNRQQQLADADKRFRLLTAEDVNECSNGNLEDISDALLCGLQSASLALSRRQDKLLAAGLKESDDQPTESKKNAIDFMSSNVPDAKFDPPQQPVAQEMSGKAESLCAQLVELLQTLREIQTKAGKQFKKQKEKSDRLQDTIISTNASYGTERENLLTLERKLETRLRQVNRMTGRDPCEDLTVTQLTELCKTINKASRRLAIEQAIREVRAQQQQMTQDDSSGHTSRGLSKPEASEKCMVCFERLGDTILEPCHHELCEECSTRLKFCPSCRVSISGRQPKAARLNKEQSEDVSPSSSTTMTEGNVQASNSVATDPEE